MHNKSPAEEEILAAAFRKDVTASDTLDTSEPAQASANISRDV